MAHAAALWLLLLAFAHTDLTLRQRSAQLVFFLSAYAVFASTVRLVWRGALGCERPAVLTIVLVGVLLRLTLAPLRPVTTVDVYRYVWEGEVIRAGENPFLDPPGSPALARLRDRVWSRVEFKRVPAAYPPVAQYVFAFAGWLPWERVLTLKLVLALFDTGTLLLLPGLLTRLRKPPTWTLLYAWHPLVVGEVVARGHLDSIGIFLLVAAARLAALPAVGARARAMAGAATAGAVLAKGYALFALPFLAAASPGKEPARPRVAWFAVGCASAAMVAYLPFADAGSSLWRGISLYSRYWHGYAPVYPLLEAAQARFAPGHPTFARWALASAFAAWLLLLALRYRRETDLERLLDGAFLALAGFLVLSPVLYPWYLAWTAPFLCLRARPGWLLLTGTIFVFYGQGLAGPHVELPWLTGIEYGLPLVVAGICSRAPDAGVRLPAS